MLLVRSVRHETSTHHILATTIVTASANETGIEIMIVIVIVNERQCLTTWELVVAIALGTADDQQKMQHIHENESAMQREREVTTE